MKISLISMVPGRISNDHMILIIGKSLSFSHNVRSRLISRIRDDSSCWCNDITKCFNDILEKSFLATCSAIIKIFPHKFRKDNKKNLFHHEFLSFIFSCANWECEVMISVWCGKNIWFDCRMNIYARCISNISENFSSFSFLFLFFFKCANAKI